MEKDDDPITIAFKQFVSRLTSTEKLVFSILAGWFVIQLCLWVFSPAVPNSRWSYALVQDAIWPIESSSLMYYSFLELFLYGIIPIGVFITYKALDDSVKR